MSDPRREMVDLPRPVVTRQRWPFPLVWLVPLLAALALAWYLRGIYQDRGAEIVISFADANGLKLRDTPVTHHGVRVGTVVGLGLNEDRTRALVRVRLERTYQDTIAKDGGRFWIVRPDLGGGNLSGISTVITGPYIEVSPGTGAFIEQFEGLESRPVLMGDGIRVILTTDRLAHLQVDSPVYFRGLQVGAIQDIRFSGDARQVNITAFVWQRYAKLLRRSSQFWTVSGTDIRGGVFSGIQVEVNNLKALISGGVAFATPEETNPLPAFDGAYYVLNPEAKAEWLDWSAKIDLPTDDNPGQPAGDASSSSLDAKSSPVAPSRPSGN